MRGSLLKIMVWALCCGGVVSHAAAQTTLVPTSGWLVGPASLMNDGAGALPCVMANQFNNGFVLRLSGGGGKIVGLAVDTRQSLFTAGQAVVLEIAIAPSFRQVLTAQAYDRGMVMATTQDATGFYRAVQEAGTMTLTLDGHSADFVMLGSADGLERIEQCFSPAGTSSPAGNLRGSNNAAPSVSSAMTALAGSPPGMQPGMRNATGTRSSGNHSSGNQAADTPPDNNNAAPSLSAQESVASAYRRLADEAQQVQTMPPARGDALADKGAAAQIATPRRAPLTAAPDKGGAEMTGRGDRLTRILDRAEQGPNAGAAAPTLQPAPKSPAAGRALSLQDEIAESWLALHTPKPPRQMQVETGNIMANPVKALPQAATLTREWRAPMGAGLRETLDSWAQQAQVRLIWQAERDYPLPVGLTAQGTFDSAVLSALKQFEGGKAAPLGQIYSDPATGQRVLLITGE